MSRALWAVAALVGVGLYVSKKLDGAGSQTAAGTGPQLDPNFQADTQQVVINAPQQQLLPEGVSNIPQGEPSDWDRLTRIDQATLAASDAAVRATHETGKLVATDLILS